MRNLSWRQTEMFCVAAAALRPAAAKVLHGRRKQSYVSRVEIVLLLLKAERRFDFAHFNHVTGGEFALAI